jgi:branched-chain amino acid transport system ATP-binding protein|tara:strand:- start:61174 stop:61887 length:714 start_codon:yes stop_codon:yes gene_type:complete
MIDLKDLTVKFGGVTALDAVTARFTKPINGIIGPNGAGKTTMMNLISGFLPSTGTIVCDGDEIGNLAAHKRTRWGLRRSFQREQIADDLTIEENLRVILDTLPMSAADKRDDIDRALTATGLTGRARTVAAGLATFDRRLVDIARCLVGRPKVLMFDEPGGGMSREETERLGNILATIPQLVDVTTLVIDHDVDLIRAICLETLVLDFGKRIAFGPTADVLNDPRVKAAYLGIGEIA